MNKHLTSFIVALFAVVTSALVLGWAGDTDYTDRCILSMSYEEYDTIKELLTTQDGREPSESEIAHYWSEHKE